MEIKTVSQKGIDFITKEEGTVLRPYFCSAKIPTIGIGSTYYENGTKVKMTDPPITLARAQKLFRNVLKNYELAVYSVTRDDINQNQFDALVSLCFNIGVAGFKNSTVVKRVNEDPNGKLIGAAFKMWKKAGDNPTRLLSRRIRESALYYTPIASA